MGPVINYMPYGSIAVQKVFLNNLKRDYNYILETHNCKIIQIQSTNNEEIWNDAMVTRQEILSLPIDTADHISICHVWHVRLILLFLDFIEFVLSEI